MILLRKFLTNELKVNSETYLKQFKLYEILLLNWNKKINLISRKSDSIEDHILNSIFFLTKYKLTDVKNLADIGTGGGFPGIPLKILFPDMKVLLVDSIQKKINVLNDIIEKMNLKNITAVCGRAEDVSKNNLYENKFDCVISKAVSSLDNLYEWGKNFLNREGELVCIKGGDIEKELIELNKMKYNFKVEVVNFHPEEVYKIEDKKIVIIKNEKQHS